MLCTDQLLDCFLDEFLEGYMFVVLSVSFVDVMYEFSYTFSVSVRLKYIAFNFL